MMTHKTEVRKALGTKSSLAEAIYEHLLKLEETRAQLQKRATKLRKKIDTTCYELKNCEIEIEEAKSLLKNQYQIDVDTLRVMDKL